MQPKILSLFSGAGGLDLGFAQAGFQIPLALDSSLAAVSTHTRNFRRTASLNVDLGALGPRGVLREFQKHVEPGEPIGVLGGPPCQGFSRGNTQSRASDPRNRLAFLYLRIVKALQAKYNVKFVLFENVLGLRDKKHGKTFDGIVREFERLKLSVRVEEHCALDYGVPQIRKRIIIVGFDSASVAEAFRPTKQRRRAVTLTVRHAISHLPEPAYFSHCLEKSSIPHHENHWTMQPRSSKFSEPRSAKKPSRSFRRLEWDEPSPTVAYGHREIHIHPDGHRRLSVHEAMLLQGFPRQFVLEGNLSAQVDQVSNAVPPPLAKSLARGIKMALVEGQKES